MNLNRRIQILLKKLLVSVLPSSERARYFTYLPKLRKWQSEHADQYRVFKNRYRLYEYINTEIINNGPVDYLEYGVYRGRSIKYWSGNNTHIDSRFFGFDTFEGLPEKWPGFISSIERNHFNTFGKLPETDDKRITYIKGIFQETIPIFISENKINSRLVINMDADLYSSTLYVLTKLDEIIVPGTIIFFDEFSSMMSEFRALEDYFRSYLRNYTLLGVTNAPNDYYAHIAIEIL